jgi:transcriptional regulator with XRE-family HTH domain
MHMNNFGSPRELLGSRLRELRMKDGLSGVALAGRLGWVQSKVSRIERGRQAVSEEEASAWAEAVGADGETTATLLSEVRTVRAEYASWRKGLSTGHARQQELIEVDARASLIRNFEVGVMPGLLQTAEYARYRFAENVEVHGAPGEDLDDAVRIRMQRQQILYDSSKQLKFVVTESVLRTLLCPAQVMRGQLDRLLALIGMNHVEFGVIPLGARMPVAPMHGFVMFDEDLVIVETFGAEMMLRDTSEARGYEQVFAQLREVASQGEDARALIGEALRVLPKE